MKFGNFQVVDYEDDVELDYDTDEIQTFYCVEYTGAPGDWLESRLTFEEAVAAARRLARREEEEGDEAVQRRIRAGMARMHAVARRAARRRLNRRKRKQRLKKKR